MSALRWVWIAALILVGIVTGAAWPGWLVLALGVIAILPPLWDRMEADGYDTLKRGRKITAICVSAFAAIVLWATIGMDRRLDNAVSAHAAAEDFVGTPEAPRQLHAWAYKNGKDNMRGTAWWQASIESSDEPSLGFPYEGGTPARILISQSSDEGPFNQQATLVLANGQIDCSDCDLAIKFDEDPITYSTGTKVRCGDQDCVNLNVSSDGGNEYASFAKRLVSARKVTIELPVYRYGDFQYHFEVAGLTWPQPGAPKS